MGPTKKPRRDISIYPNILNVALVPAGADDPWGNQLWQVRSTKEVIVMLEFYVDSYGLVGDQVFLELLAGSGRFLHPFAHTRFLESPDGRGSAT